MLRKTLDRDTVWRLLLQHVMPSSNTEKKKNNQTHLDFTSHLFPVASQLWGHCCPANFFVSNLYIFICLNPGPILVKWQIDSTQCKSWSCLSPTGGPGTTLSIYDVESSFSNTEYSSLWGIKTGVVRMVLLFFSVFSHLFLSSLGL